MFRTAPVILAIAGFFLDLTPAAAQIRVTPKEAKGGQAQGEPWAEVPEGFRHLKIPEWPLPADRDRWQQDRLKTRQTLLRCLGDLPPRPSPLDVKTLAKEDHDGYTLERFQFYNGVDSAVPGILLIPKDRKGPVPAILVAHGHGGSKEIVCTDEKNQQCLGPLLARRGYVVAAIDSYFCGDRVGRGPAGKLDGKGGDEASLLKLNLWLGRTLWGMMLRDQQCLLDYLESRPEVDRARIGATGMSMGCTTSWWLAAIDERVQAIVGVVCFTRYTELIAHGNLRMHGIYYFVPGVLAHFDSEAIYALSAPRPMLMLSGDQDGGAPTDGIEVLEKKLGQVYRLHGKGDAFRSVVYRKTGHEYLPEMKAEMLQWFERHLPPGK
jgi:dienelactone hydrolase